MQPYVYENNMNNSLTGIGITSLQTLCLYNNIFQFLWLALANRIICSVRWKIQNAKGYCGGPQRVNYIVRFTKLYRYSTNLSVSFPG